MRATVCILLLAACGDTGSPAQPPAWEKSLPDARVIGERWAARGLTAARGIVHLHSPFSHDACDGMPRDKTTNVPNEPCLQDLRAALCTTRIDFAALTDHDGSMADEEFTTLFSMRGTDQAVRNAANEQIGSRILCADGHQVLVSVGGENDLMPIMLDRHPPGTVDERHAIYNGNDAAAADAFRAAGGLVWVAHTESKDLATLRAVAPHGIEVYNLHANIDPDIRSTYLGLPSAGAISAAAEFADTNPGHPEPDLAMLAFLSPNQPAIATWNALLGEGRKLAATAGSDAHQNAIPIMLADGERGDSYRRVLRWFGNIAIVADPHDPAQIEQAMATGRIFTVIEMLGTPANFDVRATDEAGAVYEIGATVPRNSRLTIDVPTVRNLDPDLPAPVIRTRAYWIEPGGNVNELISNTNDQVNLNLGAPGAYRVEISIIPRHLGPYLGDLGTDMASVEVPWIYVSPFYVE
jgi:hypothetical protein